MRTYPLNIRPEYLAMILDGSKTIEVRVAYPRFAEMAAGDIVRFNGRHEYGVTEVARYPDFATLVRSEDPRRMYPPEPDRLLSLLREIYTPEKERLGVLAIHLAIRAEAMGGRPSTSP